MSLLPRAGDVRHQALNDVLRQYRVRLAGPEMRGLADDALLDRFVTQGDEAAFAALMQRHGGMVLGVCRRVLRHVHDAEDAFQATFLVLARKARSIWRRESLSCWLHGVAFRVAHRLKTKVKRSECSFANNMELAQADSTTAVTWQEAMQILDEELNQLPAVYRTPLVLCYLEGKTHDEAARQLDWSLGAFRGRLERGRDKLRQRLLRRGITLSAVLLGVGLTGSVVRGSLVFSTIKAATHVAAGGAAVEVASVQVADLAEGVLKTMMLAKSPFVLMALLIIAVGMGVGLWSFQVGAAGPLKPKDDKVAKPIAPVAFLKGDFRFGRLAWSPEGKTLASITYGKAGEGDTSLITRSAVRLWDLPKGEVKRTLADDELKVMEFIRLWTSVAFSPDGKTVAAVSDGGGEDKTHWGVVTVWDAETGKVKQTLKHILCVRAVAFAPDGKTLATATGGNVDRDFETVLLWDLQTGQLLRSLETTNKMGVGVAFAPDGKTLAVVLQTGEGQTASSEVLLWDAVEGKVLHTLPESDGFHAITFSSDGKSLLGGARNKLGEWDVATGKATRTADIEPDFSEKNWSVVDFAPDGKTVAIAGKQNDRFVVTLWDVKTAKLTRTLQGDGAITSLAFSWTGDKLAAGSEDGTIRLWDLDPAR